MSELTLAPTNMQPRISRNGKRLWNKTQKKLIVSEAMKPGMSVSQVSRRYDVNANLIFRWMKTAEVQGPNKHRLIPIGIVSPPPAVLSSPEQPVSLSSPLSPVAPKMIEIDLRGGTRIRIDAGVKDATLQQVLKLVRSLV